MFFLKLGFCCAMFSHSVMSDSLLPHGLEPARLLCPWGFSRQEHWSGLPYSPPVHLPKPGIEPRSPALQADSLPSEPPGKPKNTGVGSLSLLQGIFLTKESNQGLVHCRRILYQLSYQGSPGFWCFASIRDTSEGPSPPSVPCRSQGLTCHHTEDQLLPLPTSSRPPQDQVLRTHTRKLLHASLFPGDPVQDNQPLASNQVRTWNLPPVEFLPQGPSNLQFWPLNPSH